MSTKVEDLKRKLDKVYAEIQDAYRVQTDINERVVVSRYDGHAMMLSDAVAAQSDNTRLIQRLQKSERELQRLIRLEEDRAKKPEMPNAPVSPTLTKAPSIADDFEP